MILLKNGIIAVLYINEYTKKTVHQTATLQRYG